MTIIARAADDDDEDNDDNFEGATDENSFD